MNNWNVVEQNNSKLVWLNVDETNLDEIKNMESKLMCEPYFCPNTSSVVFRTNKQMTIEKGPNYSELELISRYLTTESKLYDLLGS